MNIYSCYRRPLCRKNGKNAAKAATDLHYPAVTAEFQGCVLFNVREIIVPAGSCCFFKVGGTILMACLHGGNLNKTKAENPILRLIGKNYCKESSNDEVSSTVKGCVIIMLLALVNVSLALFLTVTFVAEISSPEITVSVVTVLSLK